jgi:exodeoxyribonuclease VII small subunit
MKKKENLTIEQAFERLDQLVSQMESGQLSLEESFLLYKEGMELIANCASSIEKVEKKIQVLNEEGE